MSTHGTIAIRRKQEKDEVFVFHVGHDGSKVGAFMLENKNPASVDELIVDTNRFCSWFRGLEISVKEFNPKEPYKNLAEYSVYYDGGSWKANFKETQYGKQWGREL